MQTLERWKNCLSLLQDLKDVSHLKKNTSEVCHPISKQCSKGEDPPLDSWTSEQLSEWTDCVQCLNSSETL